MKRRFQAVIVFCMLIAALPAGISRAGQVVTDSERSWAREILSQEKALKAEPVPGTVAVLYFINQTDNSELDPLEKGLTLMLITDLSSVKGLQVVERVRLQALVEELGLGVSGLVTPGTAPRLGRLLGVSNVISGSILAGIADKFKIIPIYLKIPDVEPSDLTAAEGEVAELFRMEKELLFTIIDKVLRTPLTDQERSRLMAPMTKSIKALFSLFKAIMYCDLGNFSKAAEFSQNALKEDPNLSLASEFLMELKSLGPGSGKIDQRFFLKSLRNRTSHTDQLSPDQALRRARTPAEVERRQELRPPKPDDVDDDGDRFTENQGDCNDGNASIHPGATEICGDKIDQDCDGSDLVCPENIDNDGDGFTENQGDCNDGNALVHPGVTETCGDGIDQDCNGSDLLCPNDIDNDLDGFTENQGDCNDGNALVHPGVTETCGDGIDQDCSGSDLLCPNDIDNDLDGFTENQGDCNDGNALVHPGVTETCGDGIDQDCSGSDLLCPNDIDNDLDGFTENQGDCNDEDASIHPGATEICGDGIDQDCNGQDQSCPPQDLDQDGWFTPADCNDNNPNVNPGVSLDGCDGVNLDGIDNNCNGVIDEGCVTTPS